MKKQKIIDQINSKPIGTRFDIHSFDCSQSYARIILRELYETGYLDRVCVNGRTNRIEYWSLKSIPNVIDRRINNRKPVYRPYRLIVSVSSEVHNYLNQADNRSQLTDKILRDAIPHIDKIEVISLETIDTIRLCVTLSKEVEQFFDGVKNKSNYFDAMIKYRREVT